MCSNKEDKYWSEIFDHFKKNETNKAVKKILDSIGSDLIRFLRRRFNYDETEALSIIHDSMEVVQKNIQIGKIQYLHKSYIRKTCILKGLNQSKKNRKEREAFKQFLEYERGKMNVDLEITYGVKIFRDSKIEDLSPFYHALTAFHSLDSTCQEIIKLRFVNNLSHFSIVETLPNLTNVNSSKSILYRCMKKWRQLLKKH